MTASYTTMLERILKAGSWVVVDEIQRLPQLLNEVQRFLKEKRLGFVLCGSSARKLRRAGVKLLAGRALHRAMHPFLPEERGALSEGLVVQAIRAHRDYRGACDDMHYWLPFSGSATEVDFLLGRGKHFVATEAKAGIRFTESWGQGLRTADGIEVLPFHEFAAVLASGTLWRN